MSDQTLLSRRAVVKGSGTAIGAAIVGGGTLLYGSQPAVALPDNQLEATGVDTVTNDGEISELNVEEDIEVDVDWEGFEADPEATVTLEARNGDVDSEFGVVFKDITTLDGLDGGTTLIAEDLTTEFPLNIFEAIDDQTATNLEESEFEAESGDTERTSVEFQLTVILEDDQGNTASDNQADDFNVDVENLDSDTDGGGSTSTSTDGDDEE